MPRGKKQKGDRSLVIIACAYIVQRKGQITAKDVILSRI